MLLGVKVIFYFFKSPLQGRFRGGCYLSVKVIFMAGINALLLLVKA
jgi:hypothetical protein